MFCIQVVTSWALQGLSFGSIGPVQLPVLGDEDYLFSLAFTHYRELMKSVAML
jgi:hypothetical protein